MDFSISFPQRIIFGAGRLSTLPDILPEYGDRVLIVTGKSSFRDSEHWAKLSFNLRNTSIIFKLISIPEEPSPQMIDDSVHDFRAFKPHAVVAIGGGSVLDAGKAISAMIPIRGSVLHYLEGVGDGRMHPGNKVPFLAVPTTAGTGSEATKNAVISQVGINGFKKSLRHDNFVPDLAIVDPELAISCPVHITAWTGMDAFTQLLESYLSVKANPMTDHIALSGLEMISKYLERAVSDGYDMEARSGMAYAALCSGITLANAGLGVVHGFASSIGGTYAIPHGLICASLMGVSNEATLNKLIKKDPDDPSIKKYAQVGKLFFGADDEDDIFYAEFLINKIHDMSLEFNFPKLRDHGFEPEEIKGIASMTSSKNNPVPLSAEEFVEVLEKVV